MASDAASPDVSSPIAPIYDVEEGTVFSDGQLRVTSNALKEGETISVFANGHLIGRNKVVRARGFNRLNVDVRDLPEGLEAPFEFRFASDASGAEVIKSLLVQEPGDIVRGLGDVAADMRIAALFPDRIEFVFNVVRSPNEPRPMTLAKDGKVVAKAHSERSASSSKSVTPVQHRIAFPLDIVLAEGDEVEVFDTLAGKVVFAEFIQWTQVVGGLIDGQTQLEARLEALEKRVSQLSADVNFTSWRAREHLLLERIDLFYGLIQDRLDREFRKSSPRRRLSGPTRPADRQIDANEIEGTGYYHIEGTSAVRWRWFGPSVTLVLREVSPLARRLYFEFFSVKPECDENRIGVRINGRFATVKATRTSHDVVVVCDIDRSVFAAGNPVSLITEIEFPYYFKADDDGRLLAAAFSNVRITH